MLQSSLSSGGSISQCNNFVSCSQIHVYDDIQDAHNEGLQAQRQTKADAAPNDSFYDLLQAVH